MIAVERDSRVLVSTLSFYFDGVIEDFDGVWLRLAKPRMVFNVGQTSNFRSGQWSESEDMGVPFVAIQIAHVVTIVPVAGP